MGQNIREPLELPMPEGDTWAGTSCVVGNLLYMFRIINAVKIDEIDRRIGRTRDNRRSGSVWYAALLQAGLNMTVVTDFDLSKAMKPDGLAYVQQYDQTHGIHPVMTPQDYKKWHGYRAQEQALIKNASGIYKETIETPTKKRLVSMLNEGPIVMSLRAGGSATGLVIAYGMQGKRVKVYNPAFASADVPLCYLETVDELWSQLFPSIALRKISR